MPLCGMKSRIAGEKPMAISLKSLRTGVVLVGVLLLSGCCSRFVEIVSMPDVVFPGDHARVEVRTCPGATCAIIVTLPSGERSENAFLDTTIADGNGVARWRWLVGPDTPLGWGTVEVMVVQGDRVQHVIRPIEFRRERRLTAADTDKAVHLDRGAEFTIVLPGNLTTGYGWEVTAVSAVGTVELVEHAYAADPCDGPCPPGSGGTFLFRFRATGLGVAGVHLDYRRPWEALPIDTFVIEVTVL